VREAYGTGYALFTDGSLVIFRIGLGALLSGARHISEGMLQAAAEW